mgnify:CR=1 FL=1
MTWQEKRAAWTQERTDRLKELHANNWSCSRIAAELGKITRNAVIGKLHRLGLGQVKTKLYHASQKTCGKHIGGKVKRRKGPVKFNDLSKVPFAERQANTEPLHLYLMQLTPQTCRWPYGDQSPFTFCGQPVTYDSSYCQAHHELATVPRRFFTDAERQRRSFSGLRLHGKINGSTNKVASAEEFLA